MTDNSTDFISGALYVRVSTEEQTEFSPEAQINAIKTYAKRNNILLAKQHFFIDEGISGKRAVNRPAFMKMIALAKTKPKPFDVILVHKFDRFARSREDSIVYKSLLKRECGVKVISITESFDEENKFNILLEAMLEAMAEYYSLNLADEVMKGMTVKAERGGFQSSPPFGYKMVNGNLVIHEEENPIVVFIFEAFTSGTMNVMQIAKHLNDLGVKTKRGNPIEHRTIIYILRNPIYIAKVRWNPHGKSEYRYKGKEYEPIIRDGNFPATITVEMYNKAQEKLDSMQELYSKRQKPNAKLKTWLKGLVYCAKCGRTYVNGGYDYLQCNGYSKGVCKPSGAIRYSILENLVLEDIKNTFQGHIEIQAVPKQAKVEATDYDLLQHQLERLFLREERIKIAYQDGIDTLEEYKSNKIKLMEEMNAIKMRLQALKENIFTPATGGIKMELESLYALLCDDGISLEMKYQAAHFIINKITFSKEEKRLILEYKI